MLLHFAFPQSMAKHTNSFEIVWARVFREFKSSEGTSQANHPAWPVCASFPWPPLQPWAGACRSAGVTCSSGNKKAHFLLSFLAFYSYQFVAFVLNYFFPLICIFCPYFDSQFSANKPINIRSFLPCSSASSSKLPRRFSDDRVLLQKFCFLLVSVTSPVFGCLLNYPHQQSITCRSPPARRQGCLLSHLTGNSNCVNFQL